MSSKESSRPASGEPGIMGELLHGFLGLGLVRLSLALILPIIMLHVTTSTKVGVPANICELDKQEECSLGKCLRFDPKKFKNSRSIVTYFPGGRLGNMLTAYLTLTWIKLEYGLDVYFEKASAQHLSRFFENIDMPVLEDALCDWTRFPFTKYEGDVAVLASPEYQTGQAVQIYIDKKNFMRHEIQGGRKFYKQYRQESLEALRFRPQFKRHAEITLAEAARRTRRQLGLKDSAEITFVGIHDRRTDYLEFRTKRLGLENLYEDYFEDAMEYFREEYDHPVFLYVSDDMKWGRRNLRKKSPPRRGGGSDSKSNLDGADEQDNEVDGSDLPSLFFVGCGDGDSPDCIGKDLAVLAACNHTITTHGTFGHWAAYLAGGEVYTEYGAIIPDAYV